MTSSKSNAIGPILLATDLSARSDRALERAVLIAKQNQTSLVVLHVLESSLLERLGQPGWPAIESGYQERANAFLLENLAHLDVSVEAIVRSGDVVKQVQWVMREKSCSLVITAHSHDDSLARLVLGSNVERLARECAVPFLIVKKRVHHPYQNIAVASDFSQGAQHALVNALTLVPHAKVTIFHAIDPQHDLINANHNIEKSGKAFIQQVHQTMLSLGRPFEPENLSVVIEQGPPSMQLKHFVEQHKIDLVVLGTHGLSGILRTAMGSVAEQMLANLSCDVMIVRQPHQFDV